MEEDIKILEELLKEYNSQNYMVVLINGKQIQALERFIKTYKQKDKDNNDLRRLYRRTAEKLRENGKEELADYFLAQINEVPTFTVDDDIDYYEEYHKLLSRNKELEKQLKIKNGDIEYIQRKINNHFVDETVIAKKIEELKSHLNTVEHYETVGAIRVLQELLEEKEK